MSRAEKFGPNFHCRVGMTNSSTPYSAIARCERVATSR